MKRLIAASVWAPDAFPPEHRRYRGLIQVGLPIVDLLYIIFGVATWWNGLVTVKEATAPVWQSWWSAGIALAGLTALLGVAFPRLWRVEVLGKILMIALVSVYIVLLFLRGLADLNALGVTAFLGTTIVLPIWRVGDLGFEAWLSARKQGKP